MQKKIFGAETGQTNPRNINVLEIIGNADRGGMENYLKNFITYLPDEFQLTCICPYESSFTSLIRELQVGNVYITAIEDNPLWNSIQMATELIRRHHIDVIHAHMPKAHVLAGLVGCLTQKPVVATVHGMEITSHELGITRTVKSHLITNNQEAYLQALSLGVSPNFVNLIRNGVDVSVFSPKKSFTGFRSRLGISKDIPLIGFMGRLEYEKGPDLFLKAAEHIHHQMPLAHFAIIGDGGMREELRALCTRMKLDNEVHFVDWLTDNAEIYPELDVLAHTSRSDGTSLVLMEAMACGCPTVAIGIGGVLEIVENRTTGLLAVDWEHVALNILELLKHPEKCRQMGAASRLRIEKFFNVATNTHLVSEILKKRAIKDPADLKLIKNPDRCKTQSPINETIKNDFLHKEL